MSDHKLTEHMRHSCMKSRMHNKTASSGTYCNQCWLHIFTAVLHCRNKFMSPRQERSRCKKLFQILVEGQDLHPSISLSARLNAQSRSCLRFQLCQKEKLGEYMP